MFVAYRPYGHNFAFAKIETVGDVQKILGTRLGHLVKENKETTFSDGKTQSDMQGITQSEIDILKQHYGLAI